MPFKSRNKGSPCVLNPGSLSQQAAYDVASTFHQILPMLVAQAHVSPETNEVW